jgi:hypothetical protein
MGAGIGAGLGMAMGERMARSGPWGQAPAAAAPPPPPSPARVWHVAAGGAATGPFSEAELALKASTGEITPDTYLWTPGGPDWRRGRDVSELADMFSATPPPPPKG